MSISDSQHSKKIFTVPNILSMLRILIIIPFVYCFVNQKYPIAAILILISGLSDMFDGIIARKFNQISDLGKVLDPIADKLTLISLSVCVGCMFKPIMLLVIVMLIKEIIIIIGGLILLIYKIPIPAAKWYGKLATVIFYFSAILLFALKVFWDIYSVWLTAVLFIIIAAVMIFALVKYSANFMLLMKNNNKKTNDQIKNEAQSN